MKKIIKPWGFEQILEKNKKYLLKKLYMKKNHRCSLQYHNKKKETIYVISGKLKILTGKSQNKLKSKIFNKGSSITIKPKIIHRMQAINCCILYTPQNSDVVRLSDDYRRVK